MKQWAKEMYIPFSHYFPDVFVSEVRKNVSCKREKKSEFEEGTSMRARCIKDPANWG